MGELYKLESEPSVWINLKSETYILQEHQQRLQRLAARVAMDIQVITDEIVERAKNAESQ